MHEYSGSSKYEQLSVLHRAFSKFFIGGRKLIDAPGGGVGGGPGQPGTQRLNERHSVAVEHDKQAGKSSFSGICT